ncbi:MAG: hypothetical protein JW751_04590 [Polyangiaceae bacterium]|nr:hypothetical protein [Polyangiaceae bacterium]
MSVLVLHASGPVPPTLVTELVGALAQANEVFAPHGVSFRFGPERDLRRTDEPLLREDCTLLPRDARLEEYRDERVPPLCDPAPNVRARIRVADSQRGRLVIYHGTGGGVRWDGQAQHWRLAPRNASHSGYFFPYVSLASGSVRQPWVVAHELGHYFGLRHPHGPELSSRSELEQWLCARERTQPETLLFDGDRGFVDDTPADPLAPLYRAAGGTDPCAPAAVFAARPLEIEVACGASDTRRLRFAPPPLRQNVMGYWDKACTGAEATLTSGQGRVVRRALDQGHRTELLGRPRRPALTPAAVRFRGFDHLFATASDGTVRHHWVEAGRSDTLAGWLDAANEFATDTALGPTALAIGERLHLWVVAPSGRVLHKVWNGKVWAPEVQGFEDLGGELASRVVAVGVGRDAVDLFGRGRDGGVQYLGSTRGDPWRRIGDGGTGAPAVVTLRRDVHVVARLGDGALGHCVRSAGEWSDWDRLSLPATVDEPALAVMGERLIAVARTAAGELVGATWSNRRWTPWPRLLPVGARGSPWLLATAADRVRLVFTGGTASAMKLDLALVGDIPLPAEPRSLGGAHLVGQVAAIADHRHLRLLARDESGDLFATLVTSAAHAGDWTFLGRW